MRVVLAQWKAEIAAAAEFRTDLVIGLVVSTLWLGFAIAPALVLFDHVDTAEGWTLSQLLVVQAIWYGLDAVVWLFLVPNFGRWSESVRSGQLDMILLKPVDSLTVASIGSMDPQNLPKLALALVLGVVAVAAGDEAVSPVGVAFAAMAIGCSFVLMWAVGVLTSVKSITSVRFEAGFAMHTVHNLARIPTPLYGSVIRIVLTVIVPIAFLTTVPTEILFGQSAWWMALIAVGVVRVLVTLARLAWSQQLREYVGAMS